jgi:hypothetical protein
MNHNYRDFRLPGGDNTASNNNNNGGQHHTQQQLHSPRSIGLDGGDFSAEELQDILGAVVGDTTMVSHHFTETLSHGDLHSLNEHHPHNSSSPSLTESHHAFHDEKAPDCARTERKRSREKQRRFDVNKQFTELTSAVRQIELETEEYRVPTMYSPNNRADLIARTVALLQALHTMNQRKQKDMDSLQEELQRTKQAGEETAAKLKESMMAPQNLGNNKVMMMVPMMISSNDTAANTAAMGFPAASQAPNPTSAAMPFMHAGAPAPPQGTPTVAAPAGFTAAFPTPLQHHHQQQQQQPQMPVYSGATITDPSNGAVGGNMNTSTPWGIMPPWMMQHMMMSQQQMMMMTVPSNVATTTTMAAVPSSSSSSLGDVAAVSAVGHNVVPTHPVVVPSSNNNINSNNNSNVSSTSAPPSNNSGDQKVASSTGGNSTGDGPNMVGSNLAHCA